MGNTRKESQSVLIPASPESSGPLTTLTAGTLIYEHYGLNAQLLGTIPVGYALWISLDDNQKPEEHLGGTVREIYLGWKKTRYAIVGTIKISVGTPVYY